MDRRRPQDLLMLVKVSEYLSPFHDSFRRPWRVSYCPNQPRATACQGKPDCCLVQYCGQSRIAHIANARMHCRELGGEEALSRTPSRTAPFFIMPPPRNHLAFSLPSTILGPTAHPRPSGYCPSASSSQLHHSYPLPISTANSSLDTQPKRHASHKDSQRQTESEMHNTSRTLPKPCTELYTPARRVISHPLHKVQSL
jgi:hypothetical protein